MCYDYVGAYVHIYIFMYVHNYVCMHMYVRNYSFYVTIICI